MTTATREAKKVTANGERKATLSLTGIGMTFLTALGGAIWNASSISATAQQNKDAAKTNRDAITELDRSLDAAARESRIAVAHLDESVDGRYEKLQDLITKLALAMAEQAGANSTAHQEFARQIDTLRIEIRKMGGNS